MKWIIKYFFTTAILLFAATIGSAQLDIAASKALLQRTIPNHAAQFLIESLQQQNSKDVFEIDSNDKKTLHKTFYVKQPLLKKILLFIPASAGLIIHAPMFFFVKWLSDLLVKEDGHDDSKMIGFLFILYLYSF